MSTSYRNLVERAKRGSLEAKDELSRRKYNDTKLKGISNEKIVVRYSSEVKDNCKYISDEIKSIRTKGTVSESILLDSFNSATIEGARTTVESVKKSFSKPCTKSDIMVVNAIKAQNIAYKDGITSDNIRDIWETLTDGVLENKDIAGVKYRVGDVFIGNNFKTVHTPEKVENLDKQMQSLFDFCNSTVKYIIKACVVHFYFVYIHPFCDGNGRFARLWMNSILSGVDTNFKSLVISREINNSLGGYYGSLKESEFSYKGLMDITPFVEYMTGCIVNALDYAKYKRYSDLSEFEAVVCKKLSKRNAGISASNLAEVTGTSTEKARYTLNKLVSKRYLIVDKSHKEYVYYIK